MATTFVDRAAAQALQIRPLKIVLTVLTFPFYVIGWVLGLLWVLVVFAAGTVAVGIADAKARIPSSTAAVDDDEGG